VRPFIWILKKQGILSKLPKKLKYHVKHLLQSSIKRPRIPTAPLLLHIYSYIHNEEYIILPVIQGNKMIKKFFLIKNYKYATLKLENNKIYSPTIYKNKKQQVMLQIPYKVETKPKFQ